MKQYIANIAILVPDYDEAIHFYTQILNFELIEDTQINEKKRWVRVKPKGATETCILLAKADNDNQHAAIGNQTGGRIFLFLNTNDFWRDYAEMQLKKVIFLREPLIETYGTVAVFKDPFGNLWDLIEPNIK
jgi:catechol 2,3-dioxygenase-like lactoylglutathione lyase family enzyme